MDLSVLIKEALRALLLPPGALLLLALACTLFRARLGLWAHRGVLVALGLLWLFSLPIVASGIMSLIETKPTTFPAALADSQAIVILGGGKRFGAYDILEGETLNNVTLSRIRYGAKLARLSRLPILVSGGAPLGGMSEAHYMRQVLEGEFQIPVRWVEGGSVDTAENAAKSAQLLGPSIRKITLVTSADHMARAARSFTKQGFTVHLAPTDYINREPISLNSFLPQARALQVSSIALRELIGQIWYSLRGQ
ncbi:YdcF family protein [Chitinibacter bivalviorum]|uniref:YdcF family protein n=1 Tax=Chitinibacter bivalviorum TaxID=2739434 RepID=A0A7H9BF55_9NEIS|nr:YdcF family protein [Chitinibacter bivalviorum]QLG87195.1 YdcF family protein [Chitinibacter bivalviorum]